MKALINKQGKNFTAAISVLLAISGCSHTSMVDFEVTSSPPDAEIDVNGKMVGTTPVNTSLPCYREFVGLENAPGGFVSRHKTYSVKAFPPGGKTGEPQTRSVSPCSISACKPGSKTGGFPCGKFSTADAS